MRDSSGWRRRVSGLLVVGMLLSACAIPPSTLSPDLLPQMPEYSVTPSEIPCGTFRCLVVRKDDQDAIIRWGKQLCFIASGDRKFCRMEGGPP